MTRQTPRANSRRFFRFSSLLTTVATLSAATPAAATTLFQEDFESYAVGSNLTGQGGWVPDYANSTLDVGNGSFLPGKVLNGFAPTIFGENITAHPLGFALDPTRITTLSFDAYAKGGLSHNTVVGLNLHGQGHPYIPNSLHWYSLLYPFQGGPTWRFDATFLTGNASDFFNTPGGYDTPVEMSIVVDGIANEVYGIYDFGGGPQQTPHYAVTDAKIATLNAVVVEFDFRGTLGAELDNLRLVDDVSPVPEPGTAALVAGCLGLLGFSRKRR